MKHIEMSRNDDDIPGNLLDYLYHQKYYQLIGIDLPKQKLQAFAKKLSLKKHWKKMMVDKVLCFDCSWW